MRKIAAHYVINPGEDPIKNGIIEINDNGKILALRSSEELKEESHLEFYNGVLVPGFINVHTHLELSHLKGKIESGSGINSFVDQVVSTRNHHKVDDGIFEKELARMYQSGTQAIGDIANTNDTLTAKLESPIFSHTFIELFGLRPEMASRIWDNGIEIENEFNRSELPSSLTPHAPYSVSSALWDKFRSYYLKSDSPLSIHHMESKEEDIFLKSHAGPMAKRFSAMGIHGQHFPSGQESSTKWLSSKLPAAKNILLIHNTFSQMDELMELFDEHTEKNFYLGLCPKSNLFIENALPETIIKNRKDLSICLGTDSLASNNSLCLWDEVKMLSLEFPELSLQELIEMSSINGAKALNIENNYGSFTKGKNPGVVLLEGIDLQSLRITKKSKTKRIV